MNHNILYSFRRCPYAIRARWALLVTNKIVELREVDLKNKPFELREISKKATVPVLKTKSDGVIDESLDIMVWAIKKANMYQLFGTTKDKISNDINELIEINDNKFKFHLDRYKYSSRFKEKDIEIHREEGTKILLSLNKKLKKNFNEDRSLFLVNSKETLADWAIWPFIRQFRIVDKSRFDENNNLIYLRYWLNHFLCHKNYSKVMLKTNPWHNQQRPIIFSN